MIIRSIDDPLVEGDPLLLLPEGVLKRWPEGEPRPRIGERFVGRAIHVSHPEHQDGISRVLRGNILERCEAAARLPRRIVTELYSAPQVRNMRRVDRNLCPSLKEHVAGLLSRDIKVPIRVLIKVAARRNEAEQWAEWRASLQ